MRVTAEQLRAMGACEDQVAIVEREWPRGVPITVPSLRKAFRLGLCVDWFASEVIQANSWTAYDAESYSAWRIYYEVGTPDAWATYHAVKATALVPLLRAALR